MMNNITQDLLVSFKNFGELVILSTKLFIDYNRFIINSVIRCPDKEDMNEETEESKNKQHELKRRLEIAVEMQANILEIANKLIRSLEELQELLREFVIEITKHKSSYGEVIVQTFETLPEDKKLACFIAFMDTIEKFRQE